MVCTNPPAGPAPGTWEAGVDDYKVAKERLASGFTRYQDDAAGAAWLFDGTTFWTFDDPPVMAAKAEYARRNRLGGIMFWELSGDTPDGELIDAIAGGCRRDGTLRRAPTRSPQAVLRRRKKHAPPARLVSGVERS